MYIPRIEEYMKNVSKKYIKDFVSFNYGQASPKAEKMILYDLFLFHDDFFLQHALNQLPIKTCYVRVCFIKVFLKN